MPAPRRQLPAPRDVPWAELRRSSAIVFAWLAAGWTALSADERREVAELVRKSRGRPNRLRREEARRLGSLAGRAATAAAAQHRRGR